jgi:hypothetical protein
MKIEDSSAAFDSQNDQSNASARLVKIFLRYSAYEYNKLKEAHIFCHFRSHFLPPSHQFFKSYLRTSVLSKIHKAMVTADLEQLVSPFTTMRIVGSK